MYYDGTSFELRLENPELHFRSGVNIDTTILVAIVGAVSSGVGAIIAGLLQIIKQDVGNKIVIQSKNGAKLEIPANTPTERIDDLINKINKMEIEQINLF